MSPTSFASRGLGICRSLHSVGRDHRFERRSPHPEQKCEIEGHAKLDARLRHGELIRPIDHALLSISGPLLRQLPTAGFARTIFISSESNGWRRSSGRRGSSPSSVVSQRS